MRDTSERRFVLTAWLCYLVLLVIVARSHEPWYDETRAWQLAMTSESWRALLHNTQYEGHPLLYFVVLKGLTLISQSWSFVSAAHLLIPSASAWIVLRYAPFARHQRLMIVFSYYFAYEYAVFVRPYALGVLLTLAACAIWGRTPLRQWFTVGLLVLLANTSVTGLVLGLVLGGGFVVDACRNDEEAPPGWQFTPLLWAVGIAALVVMAVAIQVVPPRDLGYVVGGALRSQSSWLWTFVSIATLPAKVTLPFQSMSGDLVHWGTWALFLFGRPGLFIALILTILITLAWLALAARRSPAIAIFTFGVVGFLGLFSLIHTGAYRHQGHLVLAWLSAAWIANKNSPHVLPIPFLRDTNWNGVWRSRLLTACLVPMTVAYVPVAWSEVRHPFSEEQTVAQLLRTTDLDTLPAVGVVQPWSQSVAALSDKRIHFPSGLVATANPRQPETNPVKLAAGSDSVIANLLAVHCRVVLIASRNVPYTPKYATTTLHRTPLNSTMSASGAFDVSVAYAPPSPRCPNGR